MKINTPLFRRIPTVELGKQLCDDCGHIREAVIGFKLKEGLIYWCDICTKIRELREQISYWENERNRR